MSTVPTLAIALTLAVMLNSAIRFKGIYRIAYFIPNITSLVAAAIFFAAIFSTNFGLINSGLRALGLPTEDWLGQPWGIKIAVSAMIVWQWTGYNTIIYLAGLQAIPTEQYEAAKVDGAGPLRTFFSITLPQLRPVVLFTVIMSTIGGLQTFTEPQVMVGETGGADQSGPDHRSVLLQHRLPGQRLRLRRARSRSASSCWCCCSRRSTGGCCAEGAPNEPAVAGSCLHVALAVAGLLCLFPFFWTLVMATNTTADIYRYPPKFTFGSQFDDNVRHVLDNVAFFSSMANTPSSRSVRRCWCCSSTRWPRSRSPSSGSPGARRCS